MSWESMKWPDASDKFWYCGYALRYPTSPRASGRTPFCIWKGENAPQGGPCGEHSEPWFGWVQADNPRKARKAIVGLMEQRLTKQESERR